MKSRLKSFDLNSFTKAIMNDKKNSAEVLTLILPSANGLRIFKDSFIDGAIKRAELAVLQAIEMVENEI